MINTTEGICYSPKPPRDYLPHEAHNLFFAKYVDSMPTWNMLWLTQPVLDAGLNLDKSKWHQWGLIVSRMDATLVGKMTATLTLDDASTPSGMSLRRFLTLPPLEFLSRLKQRPWRDMPLFEDPAVMALVESRAQESAGVEAEGDIGVVHAVAESEAKSAITEVVGSVIYAKFGRKAG